ncbi:hypothetical protein ACR77U_13150 [Enterococcus faecium]|uniref:hypothetical protein n=1 Tax=Enterococcus faecium TaxID=1352 RepID=UPI003DA22241
MSRRPNDPTAGDVGRIFLNLLGIKSPKEISYKSGIGVVFELKAKEDGSSVLLCLPKKDFYAGLLQEVENEFYRTFNGGRFTITMEGIHWLSVDDIFGRTIHDGNIWGTPIAGCTIAIAATIGLTESEAKSRRYDDAKDAAIEKAESLIEEMCADTALPTFSLGMYDNALAAMDGQGALEVSLCGFAGVSKGKLDALAEGIQTRLDAMCPEIGWEIIKRTDRSTGNIAVLELQLSHTKPYIEEDA